MKKLLVIVLALFCCFGFTDVNAQKTVKIGHIDSESLFAIMPGRDSIQQALQDYYGTLEKQMVAMQQEYQSKVTDFQQNEASMSDIIKETKVREISDLQNRIEEFQQLAQQRLQEKQTELTQPLVDKIKAAVAAVAKENGYSYIFDYSEQSVQTLLYAEPSDDILPLVKAKLGLK
ncbi:MAG: OmpH family outer membrane protein [Bacteroidales bacterium]|nr:OmpH family outer membrane protein [Bacteroidales bacterium]MBP5782842.1 OmpH family outer membrane protein [Bacteroidales bacterium]MBR5651396.1 OmpH family outer membrane protein [Bacteroidales bacterium]MBR5719599.1 OmpH family outer membrane protein [Bacteroidales bacterium]